MFKVNNNNKAGGLARKAHSRYGSNGSVISGNMWH